MAGVTKHYVLFSADGTFLDVKALPPLQHLIERLAGLSLVRQEFPGIVREVRALSTSRSWRKRLIKTYEVYKVLCTATKTKGWRLAEYRVRKGRGLGSHSAFKAIASNYRAFSVPKKAVRVTFADNPRANRWTLDNPFNPEEGVPEGNTGTAQTITPLPRHLEPQFNIQRYMSNVPRTGTGRTP
jgi:hypothetical protein